MKRTFKIAAIVFALSGATAAYAAIDTAATIADLITQGYTVTEIRTGTDTVTFEAVSATERAEFIYDAVTGLLVRKDISDRVTTGTGAGDVSGTNVETESDDDNHGSDDDSSDDDSSDDDSSDDDSSDDDSSDDDSSDDDSSDDNGHDDHN